MNGMNTRLAKMERKGTDGLLAHRPQPSTKKNKRSLEKTKLKKEVYDQKVVVPLAKQNKTVD